MVEGKRNLLALFVAVLLVLLIIPFAIAQSEDDDADGILNSKDMCTSTNIEEGLPVIVQNQEFLGCSCSQIYEKIGNKYCFDVFCSPNRPFSLKERFVSSRNTSCSEDYCINSTLYDFPENKLIKCVGGQEEEFSCDASITEEAESCINGSISQKVPEKEDSKELSGQPLLDDYEKMQKKSYELSQDLTIRSGLGISGESIFIKQSEKTMNELIVEKNLKTETKKISNVDKTISIKTIKIIPEKRRSFTDVYVFEELPRGSKITMNEVISEGNVVLEDEGPPVILVWKIDKITEPVEITYQINKPLQGESNTLVIAKEIRTGLWKLLILPLLFIIIVIWIFVRTSQKAIPKRKRIFKD